jgi:four helix bundle protein
VAWTNLLAAASLPWVRFVRAIHWIFDIHNRKCRIKNAEFRIMNSAKKYDLEDRLITFAITIMELVEDLPKNRAGNHIAGQLIRCGTSPALNYGEVQSSESQKDFIHKMKIILKELRETNICLKIIKRKPLIKQSQRLDKIIKECNELISIFVSSIRTAQKPKERIKKIK